MRSPRSRFELGCRVGAFALIGWLLGMSIMPATTVRVERVRGATALASVLPGWTRAPQTVILHADLDSAPSAWIIDWMAALHRSRHPVTWNGTIAPVALSASAEADPRGATRVVVAAPTHSRVTLSDDGGVLDTLTVNALGASMSASLVVGTVHATTSDVAASAAVPRPATVRTVLVLGQAGWEGKFAAAALSERGWPVRSRFGVAPSVDVERGAELTIDTANVSAVVVLDTSVAALALQLARFVRSGGGLVLAGDAASAPALASLAPGRLGARLHPPVPASGAVTLGATGFYPILDAPDAVVLDRRAGGVAVAARRVEAGRVIAAGYDDSWRWRMSGSASAVDAHRDWWSRLVGAVAYVPMPSVPTARSLTAAPLAGLVDEVGSARRLDPAATRLGDDQRMLILSIILILLITEWSSRRLRGLR